MIRAEGRQAGFDLLRGAPAIPQQDLWDDKMEAVFHQRERFRPVDAERGKADHHVDFSALQQAFQHLCTVLLYGKLHQGESAHEFRQHHGQDRLTPGV